MNKGLFIGFIGVTGVGKTSVAYALAKKIGAHVFLEPGEESWPIDHDKSWQEQVAILENWVCESNLHNFEKARQLADAGDVAVTDAGIFLVNQELIHTPCNDWWYGLIPQDEKDRIYQKALSDWKNAPCPDVLVLFETDKNTWLRFMQQRGRSTDSDETCLSTYLEQQSVMAQAAKKFANARGTFFIKFNNDYGSPEQSANRLYEQLNSLL
jgi:deoxyadenosine/deoxycytidine kinase